MSSLFGRVWKVTAYQAQPTVTPGGFVQQNPQFFNPLPNGIEITGLRTQFKIEKTTDAEPNTCELTITNCAPSTRQFLERKPLTVIVQAGYDGTPRYLFTGDVRFAYSTQVSPDWETRLQLGDGDRAWRFGRINRSYKKGTPYLMAVKDAAASLGLQLDAVTAAGGKSGDLNGQFAGGRTLSGPAGEELIRLLAQFGYRCSIQDGRLQVLKDGETRPDQAISISTDPLSGTGVIGSPEWATPDKTSKPQMLKIKMLLYPELTPGAVIAVTSNAVKGNFRMERITHTGDSHGADWITEIEAKAI